MGPKTELLIILHAATHETELGDHDFCLSRSHYTDTDPTSRERAATDRQKEMKSRFHHMIMDLNSEQIRKLCKIDNMLYKYLSIFEIKVPAERYKY